MHSLARTFSLALILLFSQCESAPVSTGANQPVTNSGLSVTYIANEGVLISAGGRQVLIDGLHRFYDVAYASPPTPLLTALESAQSPYNKISLVLVSHLHGDHFHPESVGLHLKNNPAAVLVSSEQIVSRVKEQFAGFSEIEKRVTQLTPAWKTKSEFKAEGIRLQVLGLRHSGANFIGIQNLGHLIEIDGKKLLHIGDADMTAENFASFRLQEEGIDVAFIPFWYLQSNSGRTLIRDHIRPKQIIAVHVTPADAESIATQIKQTNPEATVFTRILETKNF